jgi:hypothetical protein
MKKRCWFFLILGFLVLSLAGVAYSWQGRMAGMGDPYGLVEDESDFLIHPSKIVNGKGIEFYGDYRFTYRDVRKWDYTLDWYDPVVVDIFLRFPFISSGDAREYEALFGAAIPFGSSRMGLFFQYAGKRSKYEGQERTQGVPIIFTSYFDLGSDLDAFALRFLYGFPIGSMKLGGEIQLAYHQEENRTFYDKGPLNTFLSNPIFGAYNPETNLFPFMFPYDSEYWEALFKGSVEGMIGHMNIALTVIGGFIFEGNNKLEYSEVRIPGYVPPSIWATDMDGGIRGWRIGADLFLRYPITSDLCLPALFKIEYQRKDREGDGFSRYNTDISEISNYKSKERGFNLEVGGGLDKNLARGTRIAVGAYYGFFENENSFFLNTLSLAGSWRSYDHSDYPDQTEHRIIVRLLGEKGFSSSVAIRMGLDFFYGWVREDFKFTYGTSDLVSRTNKLSLDGFRWGMGISLGGTIKFNRFTIEPFANGGYQKLDLNGEGITTIYPTNLKMEKLRSEWSIGGGLSIKF